MLFRLVLSQESKTNKQKKNMKGENAATKMTE